MLLELLLDIDIPTLAATRGLMQVTLGALIVWMGVRQDEQPGAHWWAAGLGLNGLALLAFIIQLPDYDFVTVVINHMSFGLSSACILLGFWRFGAQPVRWWLLALIVAIPALSLVLWEWLQPNARMRILFTASGQVVYLAALFQSLKAPPRIEMKNIYRVLRWIVGAYSLLLIWSYAGLTQLLPTTARVAPDYHGALFSVGSMLFMLALAVSFLALQFAFLSGRNADQARRDWLTELLNRRGFFEATEQALATASSAHQEVALLMIDVDHFKRINDRLGHATGDEVLRRLSETLAAQTRSGDVVARIGGEEFAILLVRTDQAAATKRAECLRRTCNRTTLTTESGDVALTISLGVAQRRGEESIDSLMARADLALYRAKEAGRNCSMPADDQAGSATLRPDLQGTV